MQHLDPLQCGIFEVAWLGPIELLSQMAFTVTACNHVRDLSLLPQVFAGTGDKHGSGGFRVCFYMPRPPVSESLSMVRLIKSLVHAEQRIHLG